MKVSCGPARSEEGAIFVGSRSVTNNNMSNNLSRNSTTYQSFSDDSDYEDVTTTSLTVRTSTTSTAGTGKATMATSDVTLGSEDDNAGLLLRHNKSKIFEIFVVINNVQKHISNKFHLNFRPKLVYIF